MLLLINISFALVVITKALDIYSTVKYLDSSVERNPIVRKLTFKYGMSFKTAIFLIAIIYYFIIGIIYLNLTVEVSKDAYYCLLGICECLVLSYFQIGAFLLNKKGKRVPGMNWILKLNWYSS